MISSYEWSRVQGNRARALESLKAPLPGGMKHPNLFLLPRSGASTPSGVPGALLYEHLRTEFPIRIVAAELPPSDENSEPTQCLCLAIDSAQPERVRDAIKERLWPRCRDVPPQGTMEDILRGRRRRSACEFRLDDYGLFFPCRTRRFQQIRTHSFDHHPGYYRYRLALARTPEVPEPMADFLHALFTDCPNHLFRRTVFRASRVGRSGLAIEIPLIRLKDHDIIALAAESRDHDTVSSRHENLQKYFLECDPTTIACEVPVWMESWEFEDYPCILQTRDTLTGHIDLLRLEGDGLIGVWDYKPRAAAERDAHIQVFLYALMLSLRTALPLTAFRCGYFDEHDAYLFSPSEARLTCDAHRA